MTWSPSNRCARVGLPGCLAYADEAEVQFVAGRTVVRADLESRQQRVLAGSADAVGGISCVATTRNRRTCAFAELGSDGAPIVSIFEWGSRGTGAGAPASRRKKVRRRPAGLAAPAQPRRPPASFLRPPLTSAPLSTPADAERNRRQGAGYAPGLHARQQVPRRDDRRAGLCFLLC
jgi:hypothetical protein